VTSLVIVIATATIGVAAGPSATVKITQKYLVATCLDDAPVKADARKWTLGLAEHSLVFTMRNAPREGAVDTPPAAGSAFITFVPQANHRYEVEVRAASGTFTSRTWARGEWAPVVRDRTINRIVSTDPVWIETGCHVPR
jgi:hypothetical protein